MKPSKTVLSGSEVDKLDLIVARDRLDRLGWQREWVAEKLRWALSDVDFRTTGMPDVMTAPPKGSKRPACKEYEAAAERGVCLAAVRRNLADESDMLILIAKYSYAIAPRERFKGGVRRTPGLNAKIAAINEIEAKIDFRCGEMSPLIRRHTIARWADLPVQLPDGYPSRYQWRQRAMLCTKLQARLDAALDKLFSVLFNQ